jgi:hypothetical protein
MSNNTNGLDIPIGFRRLNSFPLDSSSVFQTLSGLQDYALNNPTAYSGQLCSVTENEKVYVIKNDKTVREITFGYASSADLSGYYPINNPSGFVNIDQVSGLVKESNKKISLSLQTGISKLDVFFPTQFSITPSIFCNIDGGDDIIYQTLIKNKTVSGCSIFFSDTIQEENCYLNIFVSDNRF